MVVPRQVVDRALRALEASSDVLVLDLVADSDLEVARLLTSPRRLRFHRDDLVLDALVEETEGTAGLQVLLRLTPREPFTALATTRGREITVEGGVTGRADARGVARLTGLPRGLTSLRLQDVAGRPPARTAWVRL